MKKKLGSRYIEHLRNCGPNFSLFDLQVILQTLYCSSDKAIFIFCIIKVIILILFHLHLAQGYLTQIMHRKQKSTKNKLNIHTHLHTHVCDGAEIRRLK